MSKKRFLIGLLAVTAALWGIDQAVLAQTTGQSKREKAKARVKAERQKLEQKTGVTPNVTQTTVTNAAALLAPAPLGFQDCSLPNYANSPLLGKFVDPLPGLRRLRCAYIGA
jgi:hypothetical protein